MKTLVLALVAAGAMASAALENPERISQSGNDPAVLVYPTLPGLMTAQGYSGGVLGSGYDPLLGEVRQAIIPPSYTHYGGSTNVFMDPITEQLFKYPDSIIVAADSETTSVTSATMFNSYSDYLSYSMDSSSSSGFFLIGAYARNSVHAYMHEKLETQQSVTAIAGQAQSTYLATMRWAPPLMRIYLQRDYSTLPIAQDQAKLPASRSTAAEKAAYQAFIDRYGTHYMDTALFGGHMHLIYSMNSSVVKETNATFAEHTSMFAFSLGFASIAFGHGGAHAKESISQLAKSNSELAFVGFGGSQTLLQAGLYSAWRGTIAESAAPINGTYTEIAELIIDDGKRANMEAAIKEYLDPKGPPTVNQPFGLAPVMCGTSPGSANASIDSIPTGPSVLGGEAPPAEPERQRRYDEAMAEGRAGLQRRATEPFSHRPAKTPLAGHRVTIQTKAGPMNVTFSQRGPALRSGPLEGFLKDAPPATLRLREDSLSGGFVLPVPGPDLGVGFGYDPVTGTVRAPVVAANAHLANNTFYDPSTKITWSIPDHWTFSSTPFSCAEEVTHSFSNTTMVAEFNAKMTMFGIGFGFAGFSIGAFFTSEQENVNAELNAFADGYYGITRSVGMYRLAAGPSVSGDTMLRGDFVSAFNQLPTSASDPTYHNAYTQFLSTYGTHYVHQADLGGSCSLSITYNQSALMSYSESYKHHQFGIMIGFMFAGIGINADFSISKATFNEKIDQAFSAASEFHIDCVGGDPSKLGSLDYLGWLMSIGFHPTLVPDTTHLRPLYELVSFDSTRQALLQTASQAYLDSVGLKK
ncbi:hypothetical protein FNF31_03815 [Cafeteria roenbergensis]|uniref:MACPF domain-containing protein n=1 Tax=Cafeteria roenbergensis TaxID=33653 RepID=A0A5A8D7Y6_CAFRO|nr:hypothetical protein FNF31_03815 [Cafeteria roenbergensis]